MKVSLVHCRLVEHGEYKGNLYGTTVDSIRAVMIAGKVCVLDAIPQVGKDVITVPNNACTFIYILYSSIA